MILVISQWPLKSFVFFRGFSSFRYNSVFRPSFWKSKSIVEYYKGEDASLTNTSFYFQRIFHYTHLYQCTLVKCLLNQMIFSGILSIIVSTDCSTKSKAITKSMKKLTMGCQFLKWYFNILLNMNIWSTHFGLNPTWLRRPHNAKSLCSRREAKIFLETMMILR